MRLRLLVAAEHGLTSRPGRYLDSVIHLSYVLLRMLEKYSKSKAFMYVRKKKSKAKKRKGERDPVSWIEYDELTCPAHAVQPKSRTRKRATESARATRKRKKWTAERSRTASTRSSLRSSRP